MTFLRRATVVLLVICLGCSAQSMPPEVARRIEQQVRIFYTIPARVKVVLGPVKPSTEFPNYDALTITFDGGTKKQTYDFLLAKDGKTLLRMTKLDLSKDPYAEVMKKIDVSGRLFPDLLKEYGDRVLFIYKDFPLAEIHPWATHAAVNANCLASQNQDAYWDFADYIHANQKDVNSEKTHDSQFATLDRMAAEQGQKHNLDSTKLQACIKAQQDDQVKTSVHEGEALGVEATPTMFVNGEQVDGALSLSELRAILDRALVQAGETPPAHPAPAPASTSQPGSK